MRTLPLLENRKSGGDKVEDFLGKGDDDAAGQGQKTVGTLARIVGLEAETDLYNAPAKQDQADRTDEAEDKVAEVVDDGNGVACGKGGHAHAHGKRKGEDSHHINAVALLDLAGNLRLVDVLLRIKFLHCLFSPFHQVVLPAPLPSRARIRVFLPPAFRRF